MNLRSLVIPVSKARRESFHLPHSLIAKEGRKERSGQAGMTYLWRNGFYEHFLHGIHSPQIPEIEEKI